MNEINQTSKNRSNHNIQAYRKIVQYLFLAVTLLIGVQFSIFVGQLEKGVLPTMTRPPGIEAFLPISSLISFKYWLLTGVFNPIHPSGLIIFLVILSTAILLKRGFCSWVCPIGLLTEYLNRLHRFIFRKDIKVPRLAGLPAAQFKVSAAFIFPVGHHHPDERPRPGSLYLQPLQYGGGYQDAALFYKYLRVRFLGIGGFIGLVHFDSQLLVPLPVPLRCPSGRTQLCQYF
jgi:hypothetical protein